MSTISEIYNQAYNTPPSSPLLFLGILTPFLSEKSRFCFISSPTLSLVRTRQDPWIIWDHYENIKLQGRQPYWACGIPDTYLALEAFRTQHDPKHTPKKVKGEFGKKLLPLYARIMCRKWSVYWMTMCPGKEHNKASFRVVSISPSRHKNPPLFLPMNNIMRLKSQGQEQSITPGIQPL